MSNTRSTHLDHHNFSIENVLSFLLCFFELPVRNTIIKLGKQNTKKLQNLSAFIYYTFAIVS
ncbi:hypothetical protein HanIR_Chr01g0029541 [Helianthus annuus]|nr:hypothetical protein HanIR_Chr01g0029541 [Helianthus annuus]